MTDQTKGPRAEAWEAVQKNQRIKVYPGGLPEQVDALENIFIENPEAGIYQRSGQIVQISTIPEKNSKNKLKRPEGAKVITEVSPTRTRELGTAYGPGWERLDKRSGDYKKIDCPREVAEAFHARNTWNLNVLLSVTSAPTIDNDGNIIQVPDYDYNSGLYLDFDDNWPKIKKKPSRKDAEQALDYLRDTVKEFPFINSAAESVWLAALITTLIRPFIKTAPFFGFDAPVMASGKTLLATLIGIIANNHEPSVMSDPKDEIELQKGLLAGLVSGDPIIIIDNVTSSFNSNLLCTISTSQTYTGRILGQTKQVKVSTAVTIIQTGNNLTVRGDLSTRFLFSRLDPGVEHPEERTFQRSDIKKYVSDNRKEMVNAVLTILKAYEIAGRPDMGMKPYGRFEQWDLRVRCPLVWIGANDPCETRERVESNDPERELLGELLVAWRDVYKDRQVLVKEMVTDASSENTDEIANLRSILHSIAADGTRINARRLGRRISSYEGRICNGLKIVRGSKVHRAQAWRLEEITSNTNNTSNLHFNAENCQTKTESNKKQTHETHKTRKQVKLSEVLNKACEGLIITPEQLQERFSDEDIKDIESGSHSLEWLKRYAKEKASEQQ